MKEQESKLLTERLRNRDIPNTITLYGWVAIAAISKRTCGAAVVTGWAAMIAEAVTGTGGLR